MPVQKAPHETPDVARTRFAVPADLTVAALAATVRSVMPARVEPAERVEWICLDTHDWRLWRRGARLTFEQSPPDGPGTIVWTPAEGAPVRIPVQGVPRFATDLPESVGRNELRSATQDRALLGLGRLRGSRRLVRALDRQEKTVARLWWREWAVLGAGGRQRGGVRRVVEVERLAGYAAAASRLRAVVGSLPGASGDVDDELTLAAGALGRKPGDYTARLDVTLDPAASAAEATRVILTTLLAALRANVDGAVGDVDIEFLHDLRVAVRRTRSALGQLREVFDPIRIAPFVEEFRWLGEATSPCRDADVHLVALAETMAAAPDDLRPGVEAFALSLREARHEAWLRLVDDLRSRRFAALLGRWARFLARPWDVRRSARGGEPVVDVAAERIARAHRRLVRHVATLGPDLPPGPMHVLRIDAKKLRYLLEFFASLCDAAESEPLIAALKAAQDELGAFHDAHVQRQRVLAAGDAMAACGVAHARTLLAMGSLVAGLESRQRAEGDAFLARIPLFVTVETRDRFARLVRRQSGR